MRKLIQRSGREELIAKARHLGLFNRREATAQQLKSWAYSLRVSEEELGSILEEKGVRITDS